MKEISKPIFTILIWHSIDGIREPETPRNCCTCTCSGAKLLKVVWLFCALSSELFTSVYNISVQKDAYLKLSLQSHTTSSPTYPTTKVPRGSGSAGSAVSAIHIIIIFCLAFCHSNSYIIGVCNNPLPRLDHKDQVLLFIMLKILRNTLASAFNQSENENIFNRYEVL